MAWPVSLVRNECQQTDTQREGRPSEHLLFLDWQVASGEEGAVRNLSSVHLDAQREGRPSEHLPFLDWQVASGEEGAVRNLSSVHLVLCRDLQGPEMDTNEMYRNEMNCKTWVILKYKKMVLSSTP